MRHSGGVEVGEPGVDMVAFPGVGRCFGVTAKVRFGDTDPRSRLRLDALARLVQDAGDDDLADSGLDPLAPWVVRRTSVVAPGGWPRLGEPLRMATFCSGLGSRWGERRTSVVSPTATVEVAAVWIFLDHRGRPAALPGPFLDVYRTSANGRRTSTRLRHPPPPPTLGGRSWPLRASDLDIYDHVNNSAVWMAVEDELARHGVVPRLAEVEHHQPIGTGDEVTLTSVLAGTTLRLWLTSAGRVRASALVVVGPGAP